MSVFVDANVFLRFLTNDDKKQSEKAEALFREAAAGNVNLVCGPPVLFEVAWTLRSACGQSRREVLNTLIGLLSLKGLKLLDADLVHQALTIAGEAGMEFADAYIAASSKQASASLSTFNTKDFKKSGVQLRLWT